MKSEPLPNKALSEEHMQREVDASEGEIEEAEEQNDRHSDVIQGTLNGLSAQLLEEDTKSGQPRKPSRLRHQITRPLPAPKRWHPKVRRLSAD
jgi:hypothetical protein